MLSQLTSLVVLVGGTVKVRRQLQLQHVHFEAVLVKREEIPEIGMSMRTKLQKKIDIIVNVFTVFQLNLLLLGRCDVLLSLLKLC